MATKPNVKCLLISSITSLITQDEVVRQALQAAARDAGVELSSLDETAFEYGTEYLPNAVFSAVARADLIVALLTRPSAGIYYEIGVAQALGKPVLVLVEEHELPALAVLPSFTLTYNPKALRKLRNDFKSVLDQFRRNPSRFSNPALKLTSSAPVIDLTRLAARDFENLCFELLTQMGFRRVEWGKDVKEIDVVATLPKKDPDGFEYRELWLIALGRRAPPEMIMDMMLMEPEYVLDRVLRRSHVEERSGVSLDAPVTLLVIASPELKSIEIFEQQLKRAERRFLKKRYPISMRFRLWDQQHLLTLIQQYPQIAFKYFSEEGRAQSKYRKTPDEFYRESVLLNEQLRASNVALREEKEKRVKAERDAIWKDVAFKAAHKLGNPVFALETDLQGIKRRILDSPQEALEVAEEMGGSVEKAKAIIEQFKSLIRAQESTPRTVDIIPLLEAAGRVARENGVSVTIDSAPRHPPTFVDPLRITECFDELFANSLHWLDKDQKKIFITVDVPAQKELPAELDPSRKYVRIQFADNGCGVPIEKKAQIFSPFVTTDPHGTGLGLPMVQRVVEGHGGLIREIGKEGEGALLEMFLPQTATNEKEQ